MSAPSRGVAPHCRGLSLSRQLYTRARAASEQYSLLRIAAKIKPPHVSPPPATARAYNSPSPSISTIRRPRQHKYTIRPAAVDIYSGSPLPLSSFPPLLLSSLSLRGLLTDEEEPPLSEIYDDPTTRRPDYRSGRTRAARRVERREAKPVGVAARAPLRGPREGGNVPMRPSPRRTGPRCFCCIPGCGGPRCSPAAAPDCKGGQTQGTQTKTLGLVNGRKVARSATNERQRQREAARRSAPADKTRRNPALLEVQLYRRLVWSTVRCTRATLFHHRARARR